MIFSHVLYQLSYLGTGSVPRCGGGGIKHTDKRVVKAALRFFGDLARIRRIPGD